MFRSAVFPYIRPYNQHKLQSRSILCIFLGYVVGYKGTICYNLSSRKQYLCRHVIHNETIFPAKLTMSTSSVKNGSKSDSTLRSPIIVTLPMLLPSMGYSDLVSSTFNSQHELSSSISHSSSNIVHISTSTQGSATFSSKLILAISLKINLLCYLSIILHNFRYVFLVLLALVFKLGFKLILLLSKIILHTLPLYLSYILFILMTMIMVFLVILMLLISLMRQNLNFFEKLHLILNGRKICKKSMMLYKLRVLGLRFLLP